VVSVKRDDETGTCAVKLLCTYINSDTVNLRTEKASINFSSYTGIRVDRKAQHIVKEQRGVYVKFGDLVQFKQVDPIFEDDQFLLLPIQYKEQSELNQVVLYDEIIVSGKDLYDGKLL
ncbi:MAG: HlyD family efflux transporter periplasmic adaptor subunit, partial [Pygmaiobacter sp.]